MKICREAGAVLIEQATNRAWSLLYLAQHKEERHPGRLCPCHETTQKGKPTAAPTPAKLDAPTVACFKTRQISGGW